MSGPFRFNQASAQSPLERAASPFSASQQPVSYKTNVNRAKTKKWVEAKKNAYDGDDWGDYDEYDEYGVEESPQEPAPQSNPRYYGQRPSYDAPSRSFTDPAQQAPLLKLRKNSFDAGEEQRSFSASIPHPQQQGYAQQPQYEQPPPLQTSSMGQDVTDNSLQNQGSSPSTMPQPLQTRFSTGPVDVHSSPSTTQFPPRKSSIGQGSVPPELIDRIPVATSPRGRTGSQDKPLPFIRPADIYKRVEEERRRESMDSSRPSLDEPTSPTADRRNLQPLDTVTERQSEYLLDLNVGQQQKDSNSDPQQPQRDRVPSALQGIPTFDNDFWSSGPDLQAPASHAPVVSPSQDQGFRSVVDQAFTRVDDQRSIPPTPISKDSDSDLNRSNTGSTSGISPIMSRVPSSATAALKNRNLGDGSTPVIAEEPHEAGTPVSRPTSGNFPQAPQALQGHTRNVSNTSLPRSGLATPTRGDSPARSPAFGPLKTLPEPEAAQIATDSPDSPDALKDSLNSPHSAYATREADLAKAMLSSPTRAPELSAAERQSQDDFLDSHNARSSISDALPRDRSESPSKGRVQALAGKFGEVSHSRRGSTQSNISRNSMQSWERSQDNSRAPSPTKGSPGKPGSPKKDFRPHLPGGWESYAITTPSPLDHSEADKGLGTEKSQAPPALTPVDRTDLDQGLGVKKDLASPALADIDFTPTTEIRHPTEAEPPTFDPMLALRNAGAAMTDSIRTTVGLEDSIESQQEKQNRRSHGDVYIPRPLHTERASSAVSSIPPTPPAKDTPESEFPPTPVLREHSPDLLTRPERPAIAPQLSTDASAEDQESDRLRKEIVASLSPLRISTVPTVAPDHNPPRPDSKGADRASSILDSYYAELDRDSPRNSNELNRDIPELAPLKSVSSAQSTTPQKSTALHRFSWEASSPHLMTPEKQLQSAAIPEPVKTVQTEKSPSPTLEQAVEELQQWNEGIPEDPYFGSGHTFTVTKPEPLTDVELAAHATTPPLNTGMALASPPIREQTRSPGLHIVNSALDPEAVDLPPRWSAEHSPQPPKETEKESLSPEQLNEQQDKDLRISAHTAMPGSVGAPELSTLHEPEIKSPTSPKSPVSDKPLGAREIATIGSTAERIATYNKTRDQWATTDHGLGEWITTTLEADPSLAMQIVEPLPQPRRQSGTFRHKHTGSLAMLGKFTSSSNSQPSGGAYYEQYNSPAAQVPASSGSPTAGPSKSSSGFLGRTASHSIQTQQMQAKGKDLLHTAGVLSGKGMTSAKGLFAKGKSRFNRDKDSAHSRGASRELESVTTTNATDNTITHSPTTINSLDEYRRRRRFSSPFRRSNPRPRSVSAALPSTKSIDSTTSLTTTSTDVAYVSKAFQNRPHSYHAPDLSMHPAYQGSADQLTHAFQLHERGRARVQFSPTRASFVTETEIRDDSVPPVPPIPTNIDNEQRGRKSRSWGNVSSMLQSAKRHVTPPAKSSRSLGVSPIITKLDVPDKEAYEPYASIIPPAVPWDENEYNKINSPTTRHSSPITEGLWMGDTYPISSDRQPATADRIGDKEPLQPKPPMYTEGTPAPTDLSKLFEHHDTSENTPPQELSNDLCDEQQLEETRELLTKLLTRPTEESRVLWPRTLPSTIDSSKNNNSQTEYRDEAPLPQQFKLNFLGDGNPLLRSSQASLQEVSDEEAGLPRIAAEKVAQQSNWENKVIGAGSVFEDEKNEQVAKARPRSRSLHPISRDEQNECSDYKAKMIEGGHISDEVDTPLKTSNPEAGSLRTVARDMHGGLPSYTTKIIGVGDVSPTSDDAHTSVIGGPSTRALDMQSALESKVIGAGNVSPVSTRSSVSNGTSSRGEKDHNYEDKRVEVTTRPSFERFYTAGTGFDLEPAKTGIPESIQGESMEERPRVERLETARENAQGSSELTIPKIRQPADWYANVITSEPVASYKEYIGSSSSSSDDLLKVMEPGISSGALTPQRAGRADANGAMPAVLRRVSAQELQVVRAVEEYAASDSSLASWDQDSNAADAISESSATVEMKNESDLVTPVAQVPRNAHHGQQADQAEISNHNSSYATPNGYFNGQAGYDSIQFGRQQPISTAEMTAPERSKSLLSMISSAVSSTPISPASSNAGRSTPSTIHRMQRDFSNAKRSNLAEVQIPEEPVSAKDEQTPTARDGDYDLYADHNGVVKDMRDENGQPLRVEPKSNNALAHLARTTTGASSAATMPDTPDSRTRRYSFERPMSFISGPQDDDGRPQDQINQPMAGTMATPPTPPQSKQRSQQYQSTPSGAVYSNIVPVQDTHWPPGEVTSQSSIQYVQPPVQEPTRTKVFRQPTRFVPHTHEEEDDTFQNIPKLPPQRTPSPILSERLISDGQLPLNGHPDHHSQDSQIVDSVQALPAPRGVSAQQQSSIPGHDSRATEPPPIGPRNEFEYQQQMMQLQTKYPRFRGAESQVFSAQESSANQQIFQPQASQSPKPGLTAAIKGIVGRTSPNAQSAPKAPPPTSSLAPSALPPGASRAGSFISAVSSISREQATLAPAGQPGVVVAQQRPPSLDTESHHSQVSHGSTQVQPAQSQQDLTIPIQYQSPRSQQHQQLALPHSGQSQTQRASTGAMPDTGKKKRFSAFTGLFGRGNAAAELQGKFKLSREEKKAQKAQRHTSQPILQSPPAQQWPPLHAQSIAPQQPVMPQASGQGIPPAGNAAHAVDMRFTPPHEASHMPPHGPSTVIPSQGFPPRLPMQPQAQQPYPPQQQRLGTRPDEGSAYLRTKQMAEEHQSREAGQVAAQPPRSVYDNLISVGSIPRSSVEQPQRLARQSLQRSPPNGYYYPEKTLPPPEQGIYKTPQDEHQRAQQLKQQQTEAEQRLHTSLPPSPGEQGSYGVSISLLQQAQQRQHQPLMERDLYDVSQAARQQVANQPRGPGFEQGAYGATQEERQRIQQLVHYPLPRPEDLGRSQIHYDQMQHHGLPHRASIPPQHGRQQMPQNHHQPVVTREEHIRQTEQELAQHRWQQQQLQLRQFHLQQQAQLAHQHAATRSISGPLLNQTSPPTSPVTQRHVSSPVTEPQYDTPPIPGAYGHVQGVFVSPLDRQHHALTTPHSHFVRQDSDPQMQPISPQVSAQSEIPHNARHHSDASTVSVISPISGSTSEPPGTGFTTDQRPQKPRMSSISEVHKQQPERPWHMSFPAGTTEQDIVRARQKQFFQQQFASQQQAQAERHASSPSPRVSPDKQSPPFSAPLRESQEQGGGFREVLPRTSSQPYPASRSAPPDWPSRSIDQAQQVPSQPQEGADWSPGQAGPPQLAADSQPVPNEPHTPRHPGDFEQRRSYVQDLRNTTFDQHRHDSPPSNEDRHAPPPNHQPQYDENVPDEAPPSYDGPGVPNDGMEKSNPDRPRPPNIVTVSTDRARQQDGRPRQASLGLMQHPQPASMAASPQRTAPDMGAESLRRQMLQQEEHARMERIQRSQMQAAQRQREQRERDAARARAQELERSVSGGGRVGSLRSVRGSHNGGTPGWERRGLQGGSSRPVFELPALEDDEPVMRATSFPGQEWVPPMYVDD